MSASRFLDLAVHYPRHRGPVFLVVKYVPDLHRFEPRNIGVVVWSDGLMGGRFIAEVNDLGDVDGRSVPSFVANVSAYKQWVRFWRSTINSGRVDRYDGRPPVNKTSPDFVEAFVDTGSVDYIVSEGGILLEDVTRDNIQLIVDDVYDQLVAPATQANVLTSEVASDEQRDADLDVICDAIIQRSSVASDPNFHNGFVVQCPLDQNRNIVEQFEFSHAYKNGSIKALYQRVQLSPQKKTMRKTVHDSAWMFEKIVQNKIAEPEQCTSLVYATSEHQKDPDTAQSLRVLSCVSRVINVANSDAALAAFNRVLH